MTRIVALILCTIALGACWAAEGTFASRIADLWFRGERARVLQVAETRLAKDENDLIGLLLKREYQRTFSMVPEIYSTLDRLESVAKGFSSPHFDSLRPLLIADIQVSRRVFGRLSAEQLLAERPKGNIPNKRLPCSTIIEALEADGYVHVADLPLDVAATPAPF
jgi:hypothetical protein